jgi:hypothetical protein
MRVTIQKDESKFSVPVGNYDAVLAELRHVPASQEHPDWGDSISWDFCVQGGPQHQKVVSSLTKTVAMSMNSLGKMLTQILGRDLKEGEDIDLGDFLGKRFRISVGWNKEKTKTRVMTVMMLDTIPLSVQQAGQPPLSPAPTKPTPGRPGKPVAVPAKAPSPKYWVLTSEDGDPELMTRTDLEKHLADKQLDAAAVGVISETDHAAGGEWKTAADYKIDGSSIPF